MLSAIGAILGGLAFGYYSDKRGRRRAMMIAMLLGLVIGAVLDFGPQLRGAFWLACS